MRARLAAALLTAALMVSCSGDDETTTSTTAASPTAAAVTSAPVTSVGTSAEPGGRGCAELPADEPFAAAAGSEPQLTSLVAALDAAGLTETLDGDGPFTVFAPVDAAFAAVPELDGLLADPDALGAVLSLHVVEGQRLKARDLMAGPVEAIGGQLSFSDLGGVLTVNGAAAVVCADIDTANATVHLIDAVLVPPVDEEVVAGSQLYSVDLTTGAATSLGAIGAALGVLGVAVAGDAPGVLYGLTDVPELITFDVADPATVDSVPITGVADGSTLLAIDVRTSDRSVLGVSDASVLYSIDPQTGVATAIGDGINPPLGDPGVGMDLDEGTDRVRLSSAIGDNLLVDPVTGTVEVDPATELPVVDSTYDRIEAAGPHVVALAGSGSGGGAPVLYGIDSVEAKLVKVDSPADGVVQTVGPLGITVTDGASFDIGPDGEALLVVPG